MAIPQLVRRHGIVIAILVVVLLPTLAFALKAAVALHMTYSRGTRAGVLQKISERGWLCKTWEGELQQSAIPGSAPEKFLFSTRSDSIAQLLTQLNGQHVLLTYEQHKGVPTACFGDTEYFVTGVKTISP
jgi:hypothetical protein